MTTIYTWRDHPTGPPDEPTYEARCVDCEHWHKCTSCGLEGWCDKHGMNTGIGEGCEE